MENPEITKDVAEDVVFDVNLESLSRLRENFYLGEKAKIATEFYFHNKDIIEIVTILRKKLDNIELEEIMNKMRDTFEFYKYNL